MRKAISFAFMAAIAIVAADYAIAGKWPSGTSPAQASFFAAKGDRLDVVPGHPGAAGQQSRAPVQVELPANTTIVAKNPAIPASQKMPMSETSQTGAAQSPKKPSTSETRLPRGCEAAASPLSSAASSRLHARCMA